MDMPVIDTAEKGGFKDVRRKMDSTGNGYAGCVSGFSQDMEQEGQDEKGGAAADGAGCL